MTNQISSLYNTVNSVNSLSYYNFNNFSPVLTDSEDLREAQANYDSVYGEYSSIDKEIEKINSAPEPVYDYETGQLVRTGMTQWEKQRAIKALEDKKTTMQFGMSEVSRELIAKQRASYLTSYLHQMGIGTSSTVRMNSKLISGLSGNSTPSGSSSELNNLLSNFSTTWRSRFANL